MAETTRTSARARARFSRTPAPTQRGRFPRTGTAQVSTRRAPARKSGGPVGRIGRRKAKQPTGIAGALARLLPTGAAAKATPGSKTGKAGGIAALAAAGVAYRNREKLTAMLNRKRAGNESQAPVSPTPEPRLDTPPNV